MATVNEALQDATIRHMVDLEKYSNAVVYRMIALLNRADAQIFRDLAAALERLGDGAFTVQRLERLLESVRTINKDLYALIERELTEELKKLVAYEVGYQYTLFNTAIPPQVIAEVGITAVNPQTVYTAAMSQPFRGVLLREALSGLQAGRAKVIRDTVRIGIVGNESTDEIVRKLRGTRAKKYSDGLFEAPRRHIESIVRTAVSHTAAVARDSFMEANNDLLKGLVWLSTLDTRTSDECIVRDHLKYTADTHNPIGHSVPWLSGPGRLHWCCRSSSTPWLKSFRDLGIPMDDLDPGTRASMDGQVPEGLSYTAWLTRQPAERQDEVLGPVRGRALRAGKIDVKDLYSTKGQFLTIEQLEQKGLALA